LEVFRGSGYFPANLMKDCNEFERLLIEYEQIKLAKDLNRSTTDGVTMQRKFDVLTKLFKDPQFTLTH